MAMPTNTFDATLQKGIREDLDDMIHNIAPWETPFLRLIERGKAENTFVEWQTDTLDTPSKNNAVIQGDDVSADAVTATVRVGNYTQLSDKVVSVASTARAVKTAGRKDELSYQMALRGKAIKTDMEAACMQDNHAVAAVSDTTAGKLGGIEVWLSSNKSHGATGSTSATTTGAPTATKLTDGTQRAFTESLFTGVLQTAYTNGARNATHMFLGPFNKGVFSTFTGNATKTIDMLEQEVVAGVDIYIGDFHRIKAYPLLHCRTRTVLGIDPEMLELAVLQGMKTEPLAKTGHSDRRMLSTEYTLKVRNEKAHWKVADLTTS